MLGDRATDEAVERINAQLGLDRPILVQFGAVPRATSCEGDLGNSIHLKIPVLALIVERLPVTLMLTAYAALLAFAARRAARLRRRLRRDRGADA